MAKKTAILVDMDYCVGCRACEMACQNYYNLPVKESYMRAFVQKPDLVDGKEYMFMSPYPYDLEHCAYCLEKEEGNAPCAAICISRSLHVGEYEEIKKLAEESTGRCALYF